MKKKIILIICSIIIILVYFTINFKYLNSITKITYTDEVDLETFIKRYTYEFFDMIQEDKCEDAFKKLEKNSKISNANELKDYFIGKIMLSESTITPMEVTKISKNEFKVKVNIGSPLYTTYEQLKQEVYKEKDIEIILRLDGIFNYYIITN